MTEKHKYKLIEWNKLISDQRQSGLTVIEWCNENGRTKHEFYYWLRKLQEETIDSALMALSDRNSNPVVPSANTFVELPLPTAVSMKDTAVPDAERTAALLQIGTFQCRVTSAASREFLSNLIGVLKDA